MEGGNKRSLETSHYVIQSKRAFYIGESTIFLLLLMMSYPLTTSDPNKNKLVKYWFVLCFAILWLMTILFVIFCPPLLTANLITMTISIVFVVVYFAFLREE